MITHFMAIAWKEIRTLMRSKRAFWFLLLALVLIGGAFAGFWWDSASSYSSISARARFSRNMFQMTSIVLFCALGLITPILTATAFTSEREHKTLDLLSSTTIPRLGLLLGKWLAAIVFQVALVICLLPVLSLLFQLGGVGLNEYLYAAGATILNVATSAMMGLAFSVRMRRSMAAMLWTLGVILAENIGIIFFMVLLFNILHLIISNDYPTYVCSIISPLFNFLAHTLDTSPRSLSMVQACTWIQIPLQCAIFLISAFVAWRGLVRGDTLKPLIAKKPIDDAELLARRRRRFPYYLVDPLRRPQVIGDRQNPVIVKEQRTGAAARMTTTIRLGYIGLVTSVGFASLAFDDYANVSTILNNILLAALSFLAILIPVLAATVISREREEGTYDLLTITPLTPGQIVRAKFRAVMRSLAILAACVLTLPILAHLIFGRGGSEAARLWLCALPLSLAFLALYAALAIACSAFCQRNMTAIAVSYTLLVILYLAPLALAFAHETPHHDYNSTDLFELLSFTVAPFFSPITPLVREANNPHWAELFSRDDKEIVMLLHGLLTALLAWGALSVATWRMRRRSDER